MANEDIGALVVTQGDRVLGVISERDYPRRVILRGECSLDSLVGEIMVRDPSCVSPAETIDACMQMMTDERTRHLPVLEEVSVISKIEGAVFKEFKGAGSERMFCPPASVPA